LNHSSDARLAPESRHGTAAARESEHVHASWPSNQCFELVANKTSLQVQNSWASRNQKTLLAGKETFCAQAGWTVSVQLAPAFHQRHGKTIHHPGLTVSQKESARSNHFLRVHNSSLAQVLQKDVSRNLPRSVRTRRRAVFTSKGLCTFGEWKPRKLSLERKPKWRALSFLVIANSMIDQAVAGSTAVRIVVASTAKNSKNPFSSCLFHLRIFFNCASFSPAHLFQLSIFFSCASFPPAHLFCLRIFST